YLFLFFLSSYTLPRSLLSFPTRRSSDLPVSASHQILPEFREYERLSTTVTNAYLVPRLGAYLAGLKRSVRDAVSPTPESRHPIRSEEHTSELQSLAYLVCRLLLEKKKTQ